MYENIYMEDCPECRGYDLDVKCAACEGRGVVPTGQGEMVLEFLREFGEVNKHNHDEYELRSLLFGGPLG